VTAVQEDLVPEETPPKVDYRRGFSWNLLFNVLTKLTTVAIAIYVARELGPEILALYGVLTTLMYFADTFRDAGLLQIFLREPEMDDRLERGYARLSLIVGASLATVLVILSLPVARLYERDELLGGMLLGALATLLNGVSTIPYAKLMKRGEFRRASLAEALGSILSSVWALGLVLAGAGFWGLATQSVVRSLIFLAVTYRWAPVKYTGGETGLFQRIRGTSGTLTALSILWVTYFMGDQAIISKLSGLAAGGFYNVAKQIVQTADVLAKPISQVSTVAFANRVTDPVAIARTLHKALLTFLVAIAPVYVGVAVFAEPLVITLLTEKYRGTAQVLPILCLYNAAVYPGSFCSSALLMADRIKVALYGWIATYVLVGLALVMAGGKAELIPMAWLFTGGLVLVNTSTLSFAMAHYRPDRATRGNMVRSLAALAVTAVSAVTIAQVPLPDLALLGIAVAVVPLVHLVATGIFFLGNPFGLFSVSGVRRLWATL